MAVVPSEPVTRAPSTPPAREQSSHRASYSRRALLSLAVAGVALAISTAVPLLGPLLVALDNERGWNAAASSLMTAPLPLRLVAGTY